jgi:hypothetical protein
VKGRFLDVGVVCEFVAMVGLMRPFFDVVRGLGWQVACGFEVVVMELFKAKCYGKMIKQGTCARVAMTGCFSGPMVKRVKGNAASVRDPIVARSTCSSRSDVKESDAGVLQEGEIGSRKARKGKGKGTCIKGSSWSR